MALSSGTGSRPSALHLVRHRAGSRGAGPARRPTARRRGAGRLCIRCSADLPVAASERQHRRVETIPDTARRGTAPDGPAAAILAQLADGACCRPPGPAHRRRPMALSSSAWSRPPARHPGRRRGRSRGAGPAPRPTASRQGAGRRMCHPALRRPARRGERTAAAGGDHPGGRQKRRSRPETLIQRIDAGAGAWFYRPP